MALEMLFMLHPRSGPAVLGTFYSGGVHDLLQMSCGTHRGIGHSASPGKIFVCALLICVSLIWTRSSTVRDVDAEVANPEN